jgi:hypothetical protein
MLVIAFQDAYNAEHEIDRSIALGRKWRRIRELRTLSAISKNLTDGQLGDQSERRRIAR